MMLQAGRQAGSQAARQLLGVALILTKGWAGLGAGSA